MLANRHLTKYALLSCVVLFSLTAGCKKKSKGWGGKQLDNTSVEVATSRLHLRHVKVGMEVTHMSTATVVMVDVRNKHSADVSVTLSGKLFGKAEQTVGTLRKQSLRIPAGSWRLFALVDSENKERKQAEGASVQVLGVHEVTYDQEIRVTGARTFKDKQVERVILQAKVRNHGKAFARSLIMCAFYDKDGTPLSRSFSELRLKSGGTKPVQFIGPPGSVRGQIFVGETFWH